MIRFRAAILLVHALTVVGMLAAFSSSVHAEQGTKAVTRPAKTSAPPTRLNQPVPPLTEKQANTADAQTNAQDDRSTEPAQATTPGAPNVESLMRSVGSFALFGLASLLPAAVLTFTAFVRISVVLMLVRQALGSLQVPGTQALSALALLLTVLVMAPLGQRVYTRSLVPLWEKQITPQQAWIETSEPIKGFMIEQICRTGHQNYLWTLYAHTAEATSQPEPKTCEEFPLQVIAPAFLISELTTALYLGFAIFLPFLVVDLVVSAVLSAMGLFLLPPTLVALPIKLALFVLADGWMLVADMLLRSFGTQAAV